MSITMNNNPENTMKKLEEYRKEPGFTVPDGYYDDLYEKMMGRVAMEHQKTKNNKKYFRFSIGGSAVAATIALFVTITILNQNNPSDFVADTEKITPKIEKTTSTISEPTLAQTSDNTINSEDFDTSKSGTGTSKSAIKTNSASTYTEKSVDLEDPVLEFYAEDARSDQFQEALMDLECYYEF